MTTIVDRLLPDEDAEALLGLARDICTKELAPQVQDMEEKAEFPEAAYRLLGRSGLLSLPFPEEDGGGGQPYEVYLQVIEEIAAAWPSVGVGTSVHSLTATVVAANGTQQMREEWLPKLLSRRLARRLLPERAAGRLGRQRDPHQGGPRRRRLRRQRHQAVDQQRLLRRLLHPLRAHLRRRQAWPVRVPGPGGHRRHELRGAREEDGPGLRRHHPGDLRGRPDPGGPADRRGGLGHALRPRRAGRRPARHRRRRHRHRPGGAGARGRVRR